MKLFNADTIVEVIHSRVRLSILAFLSTVGSTDFVSLRSQVNISDGSLSQNLKKLEEVGYVLLDRKVVDGKTKTTVTLTKSGNEALLDYVANLKSMLDAIPNTIGDHLVR